MSTQNFKIKNGLSIGDNEIIDSQGNLTLPEGSTIQVGGAPLDALPDQADNSGKYLTTDGSAASWETITQYTPPTDQGANNFLSGDGTYKTVTVPTAVSQLTNDSGYQTSLQVANTVASLVDSAPTTLDTLNELAAALGDDPNFATTVATNIGNISSNVNTHIANTSNPHSVTAAQVGLGNVTNESKATMFTSPTFTGNAVLGTPASGNFSTGTFTWPTFNQNTTGTANNITAYTINQNVGTSNSPSFSGLTLSGGTANGVLYLNSSKQVTSGSDLVFDSSGNLGLGVTPSAWGSGFRAIQMTGGSIQSHTPVSISMWGNCYLNSSAQYTYVSDGPASRYYQNSGTHAWFTAPSGTAGNAITFTQAMTLDSSGNLGLGVTPSAWIAGTKAIETPGGTLWSYDTNNLFLVQNAYYDNVWRYKTTAPVGRYQVNNNTYIWSNAPSGTAGSVITLTERMRLDASGNLGIGTASPTNTLSVSGNANITGNTTLGDASTDTVTVNGYMGVGGAADPAQALRVLSTSLVGDYQIGVQSAITGTSATTTRLVGFAGNIKTAATAYTLTDFAQFFAAAGSKGAGSTITNAYGLYIANQTQGTNNYGITSAVSSGTNKWNIYASGTAANYFAGNVGIGTSSPTEMLDIGSVNAVQNIVLRRNIVSTGAELYQGQIAFGGYSTGTTVAKGSAIQGFSAGVWSSGSTPGNLDFFTVPSGSTTLTQRMRIASNGDINVQGGNLTFASNALIAANSTYALRFGSNGTERMRIDSAGNVGIGTSSPAAKLVSSGSSSINFKALILRNGDGTTGSSASIDFEASSGTSGVEASMAGRIAGLRTGSGTSGALTFSTTNAGVLGERARLDSSGNLGLGVTPSAWGSNFKVMQFGAVGSISENGFNDAYFATNWHFDGSVSRYIQNGDALQYAQQNGSHVWQIAPSGTAGNAITFTQAMTLDASGNLAIGGTTTTYGSARALTVDSTGASALVFRNSGAAGGTLYNSTTGFNVAASGAVPITFSNNSTERMRIDSSGNLLVGDTSNPGGGFGGERLVVYSGGNNVLFRTTAGASVGAALSCARTSDGIQISFHQSGSYIGYISTNGTTTAYNTSSDYRLKEDYKPVADAIDRLNMLKPINFAWKLDGSRCDGFLAHELQEVIPEAATGHKDETKVEEYEVTPSVKDEEGNVITEAVMGEREVPVYQGIDQSKIVPLLTAALQEAVAKIESLTQRIEALEYTKQGE